MLSPKMRSPVNVMGCVCWPIGLSFMTLFAWLTGDWIWLAWINVLAAVIVLMFYWYIPESPRWLVTQDRFDEANEIFQKIARTNKKDISNVDMITLLKRCAHKEKGNTGSFREILRKRNLIKNAIILTFVWASISTAYYGLQINVSAFHGNEFVNFFLLAIVEVPANFVGWYMIETRLGRRWSDVIYLFISAVICILPLTASEDNTTYLTVASLVGKFFVTAAFFVIYQQAAEIYPTSLRSSGLSISGTVSHTITAIAPNIVYLRKYNRHIPYTIFGTMCFFSFILALFVPETLNKNLPQSLEDGENFGKDMVFFSLANTKIKATESPPVSLSTISSTPEATSVETKTLNDTSDALESRT